MKLKVLLVAFIGVFVAACFVILQVFNAKEIAERERDLLKSDNEALIKKANAALSQSQKLQEQINGFSADIERLNREKAELQKNIDLFAKEKSDLLEQINILQSKQSEIFIPKPQPEQQPAISSPTDAYWAGVLKDKTDLEKQLNDLRQQFKDLQLANEQLLRQKETLTVEANNLNRDNADLKRQLEYIQKQTLSSTSDLAREKGDKALIQENAKEIKEENKNLRRQLASLSHRKILLERKLTDLEQKNNNLSKRLYEMQQILKEKMSEAYILKKDADLKQLDRMVIEAQKDSVELPPIVVRPQNPQPAPDTLQFTNKQGRVLAVNRENNFIIIDLGEDSGVSAQDAFTVYRQDQPIAEVEVIQTRKNISACDIKKETSLINVGDTIR